MNTATYRGLAAALLSFLVFLPGSAFAYLVDNAVYKPVNYNTLLPPAAGGTYIDPTFGTVIKRLTNATVTDNDADVGKLPYIVHEYSTMSPFNADNSRLLLLHGSYFALYDGQGNYLRDLPFDVSASSQPRWSRSDPDVFYYLYHNQLKKRNIAAQTSTVVHEFSEYNSISGLGESDISFDGDHLVLVGDDRDIFVYTISTNTKGGILNMTGTPGADNVYITPDNNVLVSWYKEGAERYNGIEMYDQDMNFIHQVTRAMGHMDVARDSNGEEVLIWTNAASPDPMPDCQNGIVKIRLSDNHRTCLLSLPWGQAVHISAADNADWVVVSTYTWSDPNNPDPSPGPWEQYQDEILRISLDGSRVQRLAHHRSRSLDNYYYMPRAASSRDGSRIVFDSNYDLPQILGYPSYYTDVYMMDLSGASRSIAGSTRPVSDHFEQDDAAVSTTGDWFLDRQSVLSGGTAALASNSGDRLDFTFNGTGVDWIGYDDPWSGIARLYIDGGFAGEVDTYAADTRAQTVNYHIQGLSNGPHTLGIEATGYADPDSSGSWIWADAFDVVTREEENNPAVSYDGHWYTLSHSSLSGGQVRTAMDPGARATFSFNGTAVSWIGYIDRWSGIARVYIDGVYRAAIDTYTPDDQAQARVYTLSGLAPGAHTLGIEVSGRKNPASGGYWVWVDAFETAH